MRFGGVLRIFLLALPITPFLLQETLKHFGQLEVTKPAVMAPASAHAAPDSLMEITSSKTAQDLHLELLMSLDLLMRAERLIQRETGYYTAALGRVPDVLGPIAAYYKVEITKAGRNHLTIAAHADPLVHLSDGQEAILKDLAMIDESFAVHTNFEMPTPPSGYLRTLAQMVVNRIEMRGSHRMPDRKELDVWEGVFRGHFRYEARATSTGGRLVVAVPLTAAAQQAATGTNQIRGEATANIFHWVYTNRMQNFTEVAAKAQLRDIYMAQKILHSETGIYSDSLLNLTSACHHLNGLDSESAPIKLHEMQADPTFGYQAELAVMGEEQQLKDLWVINGYGQISHLNPVEEIMGKFENVRRHLEPQRGVSSDRGQRRQREHILPESQVPLRVDQISD